MNKNLKCCICNMAIDKQLNALNKVVWYKGHNAEPVEEGRCCTLCNTTKVIPARLLAFSKRNNNEPKDNIFSKFSNQPQGDREQDYIKNAILTEYPDEDLYEDGELSDKVFLTKNISPITEVEDKIIRLWRQNKIVIAQWKELG